MAGIPETIITHNGPQYNNKELKAFFNNRGIEYTTSSPLYPKCNGFIERMIETVKDILRKADASGEDPYLDWLLIVNCLHHRSSLTTGYTELPSSGWLQLSVKSDNDLDQMQHCQHLKIICMTARRQENYKTMYLGRLSLCMTPGQECGVNRRWPRNATNLDHMLSRPLMVRVTSESSSSETLC